MIIKNSEELNSMRLVGQLAAEVLNILTPHVQAGITTDELNTIAHDYIKTVQKAIPAPLNYRGFPKSICTSVNHVVCHGIPNHKALKSGDIINIDVTVIKDGYYGDTSKMFFVGAVPPYAKRLVRITQECLYLAIKMVKPGLHLGDLGAAIQVHAEKNHYSVVREYCGHGIGRVFHENDLQILHYGIPKTGLQLEEGMTFTIEPMINLGNPEVKLLRDNWTVVTKDRKLSAQWEHTITVNKMGCEVLTWRQEESEQLAKIVCHQETES